MVHTNGRPKNPDAPKVGVGEIDTRAPFHSVKDAVSLFGEVAFSGGKTAIKRASASPHSAEKVLAKETSLHIAQKELNKLKEQLKNAENTKTEALSELEKAKRTVENLSEKIKMFSESKEAAIQATEAARNHAKQLEDASSGSLAVTNGFQKDHPENSREEFTAVLSELNAAKQELARIRQDFNTSLEAKASSTKQIAEAELAADANAERASEILKEIATLKATIEQVRQATIEAQRVQSNIITNKDTERQLHKSKLEEYVKKLQMIKKEYDPEVARTLEAQLSEAMSEIEALKKEVENAKASDIDSVKNVTSELDGAKESLQKVLEEAKALQSQVDGLKQELENLRREHADLKEKEANTESIAGNLHVQLRKCKSELEASLEEEAKASGASDEMIATLNQLAAETENARREAEEMKIKAEELKKEAEVTRVSLEEAEETLKVALQEAAEAKASETTAVEQIQALSERTDAARSSTSDSGSISISKDEFESLSRKAEESERLAEMKLAAAMAQLEAVKASENEALQRLEATRKEIDDMKAATEEALRKAEMAEAAKKAVEGELRRWREREQKKAAEAASRILAETQAQSQSRVQTPTQMQTRMMPTRSGPLDYQIQMQDTPTQMQTRALPTRSGPIDYQIQMQDASGKVKGDRKLDQQRNSMPKKVLLPSLSGIFHKKKSQEGVSPSYLPGEN